jgi:hypothetical protein
MLTKEKPKRPIHEFNIADVLIDEKLMLTEARELSEEEETQILHEALGYYEADK